MTILMILASAQDDWIEVTAQTQAAVDKGLGALSRLQSHDGSFGNGTAPVATTGLAGLAFLAGGQTPGRSKYSNHIRKAVNFLVKNTSKLGYINEGVGGRGRGGSGMHGHGYALLFLSQVYGMADGLSPEEVTEIKEAINRAVKVTEQAQAPNGGWYYNPDPGGDEGSVTITQVQALRACYNAGVRVNLNVIEKAVSYINKATTASGQTMYSLSAGGGNGSPTLTAAGMCVLTYLGEYNNPKIPKGLDYLMKTSKPRGGSFANQHYLFYGNYYATVAMYQAGGNYWKEWWPALRDSMIQAQSSGGSWKVGESMQYGEAFGTALALLSLQIPYRYLPIFQRKQD